MTISLLDTTESRLTHNSDDDESYLENIDKLRNYLRRNWQYIVPFEENKDKSLGICESGHRLYAYRMKKQGKTWSKKGAENMSAIITAIKNGHLEEAYFKDVDYKGYQELLGEEIKGAVREALKKVKSDSSCVVRGRISLNASSSSALGRLIKTLNRNK